MSEFDEWEWWGDCTRTLHEEQKQLVYAYRMGLIPDWTGAHPPTFDLHGASVIDYGGGPVSLLLKCVNAGARTVVDPGGWPSWVLARYEAADVLYRQEYGEEIPADGYDEAWIYNTLQHVNEPWKVIGNALHAGVVRIFEWVDIPAYDGHPNQLATEMLDEWLGGRGYEADINEAGAVGRCYYGVFLGESRRGS